MNDKMHSVYVLLDPRNLSPFYVGLSTQLEHRFGRHVAGQVKSTFRLVREIKSHELEPILFVAERNIESYHKARRSELYFLAALLEAGFWTENPKEDLREAVRLLAGTDRNRARDTVKVLRDFIEAET